MKYQIDQSGKIEKTNKDTVLCLSNKVWDAGIIKARTKRQLQEIFRRNGQPRNFVIFTFCAGIALLLRRNPDIKSVVIDREYWGKEAMIKNILEEMLVGSKLFITFDLIGRTCSAHFLAKTIAKNQYKPKVIFSLADILKIIKMTEVGKRLKDA